MREHNEAVNRLDFIAGPRARSRSTTRPGTVEIVRQHDGTLLKLRKLAAEYNVHDRIAAMTWLQEREAAGEIVTGLLYVDPEPEDLHHHLNTVETAFNALDETALIPGLPRWRS